MRYFPRLLFWLAAPALLVAEPCQAAEPRAGFALQKGWVACTLRQDGKPIANADIQIIDEHGTNFASGETGPDGQAEFPLPRGSSFLVEIKAGARTADPIRLYKTEAGIEPARVLLSYGLRPCCRVIGQKETVTVSTSAEPSPSASAEGTTVWLAAGSALAGISGVALLFVWMRRRVPTPDAAPRI